jgi:hypothetical protein
MVMQENRAYEAKIADWAADNQVNEAKNVRSQRVASKGS